MKATTFSLTILCLLGLISCVDQAEHAKAQRDYQTNELDNASRYYYKHYQIFTLEGCEYVVVDNGSSKWGSHKGNCSNPIHQPTTPIDTTEKHFDCYVEHCERLKSEWEITTECGITFWSRKKHQIGSILPNFKSPKHK
jgi:hypothetical protein